MIYRPQIQTRLFPLNSISEGLVNPCKIHSPLLCFPDLTYIQHSFPSIRKNDIEKINSVTRTKQNSNSNQISREHIFIALKLSLIWLHQLLIRICSILISTEPTVTQFTPIREKQCALHWDRSEDCICQMSLPCHKACDIVIYSKCTFM